MKEIFENKKGITLIALIITVIVLLILAAVTITTLTGENGILTQANKAKTSNTEGDAREQFALIANEWAIEKNTSNKTLGEFLNEKITEGKLSIAEDNGDATYTIKLNGYQTIIDQNGKISSVFNPEEWDKTASDEDCFYWESDDPNNEGYGTVIGYNAKIESYTKLRYPSRCEKITFSANLSSKVGISSFTSREFTNNILKVEIPGTVNSIGTYAFGHDASSSFRKLEEIVIPDSVTSIGNNAFYNTAWYNNQPDGLVYVGKVAYKYKGAMPSNTSIQIREGTTGISIEAFSGYSNLTGITIPNSVTSIGGRAFSECSSLTNITIPNSVTSMGYNVFFDWTSSQTINIKGYTSAPSGWDSNWNDNCSATINWNQ